MQSSVPAGTTIIVTAADDAFFPLLRGMISSVLAHRPNTGYVLGCFDLGLTDEQREWLANAGVSVIVPHTGLRHGITSQLQGKLGYLARPYLKENFPGYEIYIWLDADTWLQSWEAVDRLHEGAASEGGAFVREDAPEYRDRLDLKAWRAVNFRRGFGMIRGLRVFFAPHINNGVFALHSDAPHWDYWRSHYQSAIDRCGRYAPFDQFGLNAAIYLDKLPASFLPPTNNWICDLVMPKWNSETGLFCRPNDPSQAISVMHLAGPAKRVVARIATTSGGLLIGGLRYDDEREERAL